MNYREIYLHGTLMGLLGNNLTCIHLWGLDILGLPGELEGLRVYVRGVLIAGEFHKK